MTGPIETSLREARFAVRALARQPGFVGLEYAEALGIRPALGRFIARDDGGLDSAQVVHDGVIGRIVGGALRSRRAASPPGSSRPRSAAR